MKLHPTNPDPVTNDNRQPPSKWHGFKVLRLLDACPCSHIACHGDVDWLGESGDGLKCKRNGLLRVFDLEAFLVPTDGATYWHFLFLLCLLHLTTVGSFWTCHRHGWGDSTQQKVTWVNIRKVLGHLNLLALVVYIWYIIPATASCPPEISQLGCHFVTKSPLRGHEFLEFPGAALPRGSERSHPER